MSQSIQLPSCISHLEEEIKIDTLEDAMKFEILMEVYKKNTYLEISQMMEDNKK